MKNQQESDDMCRSNDHGGRRCPSEFTREHKDKVNERRRELRYAHKHAGAVTFENAEKETWKGTIDTGDIVWVPLLTAEGSFRSWSGPFRVSHTRYNSDDPSYMKIHLNDFDPVVMTPEMRKVGFKKVQAVDAARINGVDIPEKITNILPEYKDRFPSAGEHTHLVNDLYYRGCERQMSDTADSDAFKELITDDEEDRFANYCGSAAAMWNRNMRDGGDVGSEYSKESIMMIRSSLNRVPVRPEPTLAYRGLAHIRGQFETTEEMNDWVDQTYPVGGEVVDKAFMSVSSDPEVGLAFASKLGEGDTEFGVVYEILTKKGAQLDTISYLGNLERERLLPDNAKLKVVGVSKNVPGRSIGSRMTVIHLIDDDS